MELASPGQFGRIPAPECVKLHRLLPGKALVINAQATRCALTIIADKCSPDNIQTTDIKDNLLAPPKVGQLHPGEPPG
jgi:hypothetical protein